MESVKQRAIDKLYSVEKNHCGLLWDSPYRTIFAGDEDGVGDNALSIFECFRKNYTEKTRSLHREIYLNDVLIWRSLLKAESGRVLYFSLREF